eukprot:SAG31_NODE_706_length_12688_cov_41.991342_12_plen_91_part_00
MDNSSTDTKFKFSDRSTGTAVPMRYSCTRFDTRMFVNLVLYGRTCTVHTRYMYPFPDVHLLNLLPLYIKLFFYEQFKLALCPTYMSTAVF